MAARLLADDALDELQVTDTPTRVQVRVRLVEKKPGRVPPIEEVRPLLENVMINKKDPGAFQRIQNSLKDFQDKANIQINLKEYQPIVARFKAGPPQAPAAAAPMQRIGQ